MPKSKTETKHEPVLLQEVIEYLDPKKGQRYLDLTAGYGGHASAIINRTKAGAVLVDRDIEAIQTLAHTFEEFKDVEIVHQDYCSYVAEAAKSGQQFDLVLIDLGVSSPHLDKADRGFSIQSNGPLDMRMDNRQQLTAAEVVNTYSEQELTRILREYGEEPKARAIARAIVAKRPLNDTEDLVKIAKKAWPFGSKSHPATRLFQAIRIEVNNELTQLKNALPDICSMLTPNGRLAIISFHSLEDRIVKQYFKEITGNRYDSDFQLLTKKPIVATPSEVVFNPRARSAKMRAVAKIKIKKEGQDK